MLKQILILMTISVSNNLWCNKCKVFHMTSITRENKKNYIFVYLHFVIKENETILFVQFLYGKLKFPSFWITIAVFHYQIFKKIKPPKLDHTMNSDLSLILDKDSIAYCKFSYNWFSYLNILGNSGATLCFPTFIILQCLHKLVNFTISIRPGGSFFKGLWTYK